LKQKKISNSLRCQLFLISLKPLFLLDINSHMLKIYPALPHHYPTIQQIATITWYPTYGHILTQAQTDFMLEWMYSLDSIKEQVEIKGNKFLIVELDDRIVGFAAYELNYQDIKTRIHKLYVLPELHGKGIGLKLIEYISELTTSNSHNILNLNVNRFNKAVGFYNKIGFQIVGEEDIDIGRGYLMEDYIMEKVLN
jgi:GNAT superfamily N-acetyltransferase